MLSEIQVMLREVFRTGNELTYPVSGTGTAGMECALTSVLEPDEVVVILVSGFFADRMRQIANRLGANVISLGDRWGAPVALEVLARSLAEHSEAEAVFVVHGEASTSLH